MGLDLFLSEHWERVEADWQEYYGLDLGDAVHGGGGMSARRVQVLTLGLPHRSRTMRAAEPDAWPSDETLMGLVVERLDALAAITVKAAGGKRVKPAPPVVPRPKRRRHARPAVPATDMLADLDRALGVG